MINPMYINILRVVNSHNNENKDIIVAELVRLLEMPNRQFANYYIRNLRNAGFLGQSKNLKITKKGVDLLKIM